jgi:DNA polymerase-3 subunit gamma/tau
MVYQVLARGWRPQRFDEIVGQEAVVTTLKNALASGRLGHAYLFSGLRGVGKTTAARLLAKAVNCVTGPVPEPCNECVACTEVGNGSSLDVVELDGASNRGIDDVRELRELLRYKPTRDRFRVIIIDEVHMLTREAFNALLKSLEEPPPYIIFVLATTERQKVPATILSRCQQLEFRPVSTDRIRARLEEVARGEGFELSPPAAQMIARAALGSVRDALSLVDQLRAFASDRVDEEAVATVLGVPRFERVVRLVEVLAGGSAADGLTLLREELMAGHDPSVVYQETGRALRAMVHLAVDPELEPALTDDQRRLLTPLAEGYGAQTLGRMLGLWLEHEPLLRDTTNRELALEVACLRLARWPAVRRVEGLLAGEDTVVSPPGGGSAPPTEPPPGCEGADGGAGDESISGAPSEPRGRLSRALWEADQRQLAGAVDRATVHLEGHELVLVFDDQTRLLAATAETHRDRLLALGGNLFDGLSAVRVVVEGSTGTLAEEVVEDPQVALARRVLGGDIVAVRPDPEGE